MKKFSLWICLLMGISGLSDAQDRSVAFSSSNLPVILIDPHGNTISDTPKIIADMDIIFNGKGVRNDTADVPNNYDGKIAIEIRGSSSQSFPKKQYGVELRDASGTADHSASLLGMPEEEDWVLFAPYNDKSLMRDVLAYKLGRDLGHYAPRTRYCEVFIKQYDPHLNKVHYYYKGIYVLIEKVKRDDNRVDIAKLNPDEISGDDLTGGYIIKIDKTTGTGGLGWGSPYPPYDTHDGQTIYYQYDYPKYDEITWQQRNYVKDFITTFEESLKGTHFKDKVNGYVKHIDVESFIDFMIMQEVTRNVDGYRLSTYLHKQKDSDGGKLVMGPIWDFNLGFGNADYCSGWKTYGWMYNEFNPECASHGAVVPFWWRRLMEDPAYRNKLATRWTTLRQGKFSTESIHHDIDSIYALLNQEAAARNFQAWDVLGNYVWPNSYVGGSFLNEVNFLKEWINDRMDWLDAHMPHVVTDTEGEISDVEVSFYPNPVDNLIKVDYEIRKPGTINIRLLDVAGRELNSLSKSHVAPGQFSTSITTEHLPTGIIFAHVQLGDGTVVVRKLVK